MVIATNLLYVSSFILISYLFMNVNIFRALWKEREEALDLVSWISIEEVVLFGHKKAPRGPILDMKTLLWMIAVIVSTFIICQFESFHCFDW